MPSLAPRAQNAPPDRHLLALSEPRLASLKLGAVCMLSLIAGLTSPYAQTADRARTEAAARRVNERIAALQHEADGLAGEARTLIGELRKLELERDIQIERAQAAEAGAAETSRELERASEAIASLERERTAQIPELKLRFVDLYKRGRGGYTRMLLGVTNVRDLGRTARAVASLARVDQQKVDEHRRTLESLREERASLEQKSKDLASSQAEAQKARAAAERAVTARNGLLARIDSRRDLAAQLTGELQSAGESLQVQLANLAAGRPAEAVAIPLAPFRGALDWPVTGRVSAHFGETSGRPADTAVKNGIEIEASEGVTVHAIHGGTVAFADAFSGFGNLVIVDHGANCFSLYGYLASASVGRGDRVDSGAEVGRVGSAPAGPAALYFEMRVDGRSVDPVQWLRAR